MYVHPYDPPPCPPNLGFMPATSFGFLHHTDLLHL
jgi:hypothetical protein